MKIKQKFILSIVIFYITLLALGISVFVGYQYITIKASLANDLDREAIYLHMMLRGLNDVIISAGSTDSMRIQKDVIDGFDTIHNRLTESVDAPESRKVLIEHIDPQWMAIKASMETYFNDDNTIDNDEAMVHAGKLIIKIENILNDINQLSEQTRDIVSGNSEKFAQTEKLAIILGIVLLILVSTLVYQNTYKSIMRRIEELNAVAQGLAEGNLNVKIDESKEDEFGLLARHFNKSTEQLQSEIRERNRAEEELVEYSERLERSNTELQEFAFVASHDLQEPLRKVLAFSGRLKTNYSDRLDDRGRDYIARMQYSVERMQKLIDGLLSFSRVTSRAIPFEQIDLKKITEEVIADLEVSIEKSGATVEVSDMGTIDADPHQIQQVLQNLIHNALKFTKKGTAPLVKVYGRPHGNKGGDSHEGDNRAYYDIVVEDNGIGFDEKYTDRIFGVFQRLNAKDQYEGTGMGLSICRKIAERHRGDVTAKSTPGEGASFIVTLPVKQEGSST